MCFADECVYMKAEEEEKKTKGLKENENRRRGIEGMDRERN